MKYKPGLEELTSLRKKAEQGDVFAQYQAAAVLATGFMGEQNIEESFYWYMKAAYKGHIEAKWNAGVMLIEGEGTKKDLKAGSKLIMMAANENCYAACRFLGDAYRNGIHGLEKDKKRSNYWYEKAENSGELDTQKIGALIEDSTTG